MQEGCCGLISAAERFDPARGFRFSTFAKHWVRQHMSRALARNSRMIRLPQRVRSPPPSPGLHGRASHTVGPSQVHEKVVSMGKMMSDMTADLGREPTLQEIASKTQLSQTKVTHCHTPLPTPLSPVAHAQSPLTPRRSSFLPSPGQELEDRVAVRPVLRE